MAWTVNANMTHSSIAFVARCPRRWRPRARPPAAPRLACTSVARCRAYNCKLCFSSGPCGRGRRASWLRCSTLLCVRVCVVGVVVCVCGLPAGKLCRSGGGWQACGHVAARLPPPRSARLKSNRATVTVTPHRHSSSSPELLIPALRFCDFDCRERRFSTSPRSKLDVKVAKPSLVTPCCTTRSACFPASVSTTTRRRSSSARATARAGNPGTARACTAGRRSPT